MWHGAGHCKAAGDCSPCDRHVRSGAESPQDSARSFELSLIHICKVIHAEVVDTNGSGHGALAGFLMQNGVDTLICGGIGGGAQAALAEAGIKLYGCLLSTSRCV